MSFATISKPQEHQLHAVAKMLRSRVGALFMEMGTGKSFSAILLAWHRRSRISNVVWFCPVNNKNTIEHEIRKHTNSQDTWQLSARSRKLHRAYWTIVGIESMSQSDRLKLMANQLIGPDSMVIVDESQFIKGYRAARTDWITRIAQRARYRLILTGTPISQGVIDLFAQMRFLSPKILGYSSFYSFAANHLEYSDKFRGMIVRAHNTEYLAAKMQPYVYQVTKAECLTLPDKLYETHYFEMTWQQKEAYEEAKEELLQMTLLDDWDSLVIFRLFTALQKIVSGYTTAKDGTVKPLKCHRQVACCELIDRIPAGEKIIIWAKYVYDLTTLQDLLQAGYGSDSCRLYYGQLSEAQRQRHLDEWKNGSPRFLLATPSSGGHGLTLNQAAYVIVYSQSFKYAERLQLEDRNHRIGQNRPVTYLTLCCSPSIDDRIMQAHSKKGGVVENFRQEIANVKDKGKLKKLIQAL